MLVKRSQSFLFLTLSLSAIVMLFIMVSSVHATQGDEHDDGSYAHHDNYSGRYDEHKGKWQWRGPHKGCHIKGKHYHHHHGGHGNPPGALDCSQADASPSRLWPANHRFKQVSIAGLSTSNGAAPEIIIQCVYQDEPLNGLGDGNTEIDAKLNNDGQLLLRKERAGRHSSSGRGNGRVYHVDFQATDTAAGESCLGSVAVEVPHRRWGKAKDDGRHYVSLDNGYNCGGDTNQPPVITSQAITTATELLAYQYAVIAADPEGGILGYQLIEAPVGMTITGDGLVEWQPALSSAGNYAVTLEVGDGQGGSTQQSYSLMVNPRANTAPIFISSPVVYATEAQLYSYQLVATDNENDAIGFALATGPVGLSVTLEGLVQWTPADGQVGDHNISVEAIDALGAVAQQTFVITVAPKPNGAPEILSTPIATVDENSFYQYTVLAIDPEGSTLTYQLVDSPVGMALTANVIEWSPSFDNAGEYTVEIEVADDEGGIATQVYLLTVNDVNRSPIFVSVPELLVAENTLYQYVPEAVDDDADLIGYALVTAPDGMALNSDGLIEWVPDYDAAGDYSIEVSADDGRGGVRIESFLLTVTNTNRDPQITSTPVEVATEDSSYSYQLESNDDDGDLLSYRLIRAPEGMSVDATGLLQWLLGFDSAGDNSVEVAVTDGVSEITQLFIIVVANVNQAPIATPQTVTLAEDTVTQITLAGTDADAETLSYSLVTEPVHGVAVLTGDQLEYIPVANYFGSDSFTFIVNDGIDDSLPATVDVVVTAVNDAPILNFSPSLIGQENSAYTAAAIAADVEGDLLLFSLLESPAGMQIDSATGEVSWLPGFEQAGDHGVSVTVMDVLGASSSFDFMITVANTNRRPIVNDISVDTNAEQSVGIPLLGIDGDGDAMSYEVLSPPVNGNVSINNNLAIYVPNGGFVGVDSFGYIANDGLLRSVSATVQISVVLMNTSPIIVSAPVTTVSESGIYNYTVEAIDQESDVVSYSLIAAPSGMTIDSVSGELSWSVGSDWSNGHKDDNNYCHIPASSQTIFPPAIDSVMVVDGSVSNQAAWPWAAQSMAELHAELVLEGIGADALANQYGLVGFMGRPESTQFENGLFGTISELFEVTFDGESPGGTIGEENAHVALQYMLDTYPFRSDTEKSVIWIPDERQQGVMDSGETIEQLTQRFLDNDIKVHAITSFTVNCIDGRRALGFDADGRAYIENDSEGFDICDADIEPLFENTNTSNQVFIDSFVLPAIATGGSAWDLSALVDSNRSVALRSAITRLMYKQSVEMQQQLALSDLVIADVAVVDPAAENVNVDVTIRNRGLADVSNVITITLQNDAVSEIYGSKTLNNLTAGSSDIVSFTLPDNYQMPISAFATSALASECVANNNDMPVALVSVAASDSNALAIQTFAIVIEEINEAPVITSAPILEAPIGQQYQYQLEITDDLGDDHQFTVSSALDFQLDSDSGLLSFRPTDTDVGAHTVQVIATDLAGASATQEFVVDITSGYVLPLYGDGPSNSRGNVGYDYSFTPIMNADASAQLSHKLIVSPDGMSIDATNGSINWLPSELDIGRLFLVTMIVEDQFGNTDDLSFFVFGSNINTPPVISGEPVTIATLGTSYVSLLTAVDSSTREELSVESVTSIAALTSESSKLFGSENEFRITAQWDASEFSSLYPQHIRTTDYLCLDDPISQVRGGVALKLITTKSHDALYAHALAFPMIDTNGDGLVTAQDNSQVVYFGITGGNVSLFVIDPHTGDTLWSRDFNSQLEPIDGYVPAIADITGDEIPDIVMVSKDYRLFVMDSADGSIHWVSEELVASNSFSKGRITLTDLNNDGQAEILVGFSVFDSQGNRLLELDVPQAIGNSELTSPIYPVDIDLDGEKDLVQGSVIRKLSGEEIWRVPFTDGHSSRLAYWAFANFDADSELEMVIVERPDTFGQASMSLVDSDGSILWGPNAIDKAGQPIVSDFDFDGSLEIFVSGEEAMFHHDGGISWRYSREGPRSDGVEVIAVDLQGNGRLELILSGGDLPIIDSLTGSKINSIGFGQTGSPLISDFNQDGIFEIVRMSGRVDIFSTSRRIENGSLPSVVNQRWIDQVGLDENLAVNVEATNTFSGTQDQVLAPSGSLFAGGLPDLWVSSPQGDPRGQVVVDITNRGTANYIGDFNVELFAGDPEDAGVLIASQVMVDLSIAESQTIVFDSALPENFVGEIVARISLPALVEECQTNNNMASAHMLDLHVVDHAGTSDSVSYFLAIQYVAFAWFQTLEGSVEEGQLLAFDVGLSFRDTADDNQSGIYYFTSDAPAGMTIDVDTGFVSWRPQKGQAGFHSVPFKFEAISGGVQANLLITVTESDNDAPKITSVPNTILQLSESFSYTVEAEDIDLDTLVFGLEKSPDGMTIDSATGVIQWTPSAADSYNVTVVVSDGVFTDTQVFQIIVNPLDAAPPTITSMPVLEAIVGQQYTYDLLADDPEGGAVRYSLEIAPSGMQIDEVSGSISWVPNVTQVGSKNITVMATDLQGLSGIQSFSIVVASLPNALPIISSVPPLTVFIGEVYNYQVVATDMDGDILTYTLPQSPDGLSVSDSGLIYWDTSGLTVGVSSVVVVVSDGVAAATQSFDVTLIDAVEPVTFELVNQPKTQAFVGSAYSYLVAGVASNFDMVAISLFSGPQGMSIAPSASVPDFYQLNWMPDEADCMHEVTLELIDTLGNSELKSFSLDVYNAPKKQNRFQCSVDAEFCTTR